MSGLVQLWLTVREQQVYVGANELWTKQITTAFAPQAGDTIYLSKSTDPDDVVAEEGHGTAVAWQVKRHYWAHDGFYFVELVDMIVDPEEHLTFAQSRYARSWSTATDYRPEPMLERGGWVPYDVWRSLRGITA